MSVYLSMGDLSRTILGVKHLLFGSQNTRKPFPPSVEVRGSTTFNCLETDSKGSGINNTESSKWEDKNSVVLM